MFIRVNDHIALCPLPISQNAKTVHMFTNDAALPGCNLLQLRGEVSKLFFQLRYKQFNSKSKHNPIFLSNLLFKDKVLPHSGQQLYLHMIG